MVFNKINIFIFISLSIPAYLTDLKDSVSRSLLMNFSHHIHDTFNRSIYYFNDYVLSSSPRLTELEEKRDNNYHQAYKELRENHDKMVSEQANIATNINTNMTNTATDETEQKNNNKPVF